MFSLLLLLPLQAFAAPTDAPTATAAELAVVKALSPRHGTPSCDELAKSLDTPTESFVRIAEHVEQPPWVSIRAATCAVQREDAAPHLTRWVSTPELAGLGSVVVHHIDAIPTAHRIELATLALSGPKAERVRAALATSAHAEIRALVQ